MLQAQTGMPGERIDLDEMKKMILKAAGFADVDVLFTAANENAPGPAAAGPGNPGAIEPNPGAATAALQALAFSGGGQ
jgi:hypothetical protein